MSSRRRIQKKDPWQPNPAPDILQTRPFSNGKKARESRLPETNILQTRPFANRDKKLSPPEDTRSPEQIEAAKLFGYNAANIPSYGPSTPTPVQREEILDRDTSEQTEVEQISQEPTLQLKCSACEKEEAEIQRSPDSLSNPIPGIGTIEGSHPTLRRGSSGPSVMELQTKLNAVGTEEILEVDGEFGPKTQGAVIAFQQANDLLVDGIVGNQTWGALEGAGTLECSGENTNETDTSTPIFSDSSTETLQTKKIGDISIATTPIMLQKQAKACPIPPKKVPSQKKKPPKPASKNVKTQCQAGECHSLIVDDGGKGDLIGPDVVLNPTGKSSYDLFKELFTPPDQNNGLPMMSLSELIKELVRPAIQGKVQAAVLANVKSFDDFLILRGSLPEIINGLNTLDRGVDDSSLNDVFLKKDEIKGVPDERSLVKDRINALRTLCESQKDNSNTQSDPKASDCQRLVAISMSQVGTVFGDTDEAVDPNEPGEGKVRIGYQRIAEYFATGFGDSSYLDPSSPNHKQVKHKVAGDVFDGKDESGKNKMRHTNDILPEWCGIFVLWAFKSAGFSVGAWEPGTSIPHIAGFNKVAKTDVKPGDVGMVNRKSHQFIVVKINGDGDTLTTVEGNTDSSGSPVGGQVFMHTSKRAISTTDVGFFRADDLA